MTFLTQHLGLGCFNPHLVQIWTNPNVGLKMTFKMLTQLQLSLSTVKFLMTFLTFGLVHI